MPTPTPNSIVPASGKPGRKRRWWKVLLGSLGILVLFGVALGGYVYHLVYVLGVSNGAALGFRLACEYPAKFTAFACFIGGMSTNRIRDSTNLPPVPIRIVNSTRDPLVRWEGGPVKIGSSPPIAILASVEQTVAYWTNRNRTEPTPRARELPNVNADDHSTVTQYDYTGEVDVILVRGLGPTTACPRGIFVRGTDRAQIGISTPFRRRSISCSAFGEMIADVSFANGRSEREPSGCVFQSASLRGQTATQELL